MRRFLIFVEDSQWTVGIEKFTLPVISNLASTILSRTVSEEASDLVNAMADILAQSVVQQNQIATLQSEFTRLSETLMQLSTDGGGDDSNVEMAIISIARALQDHGGVMRRSYGLESRIVTRGSLINPKSTPEAQIALRYGPEPDAPEAPPVNENGRDSIESENDHAIWFKKSRALASALNKLKVFVGYAGDLNDVHQGTIGVLKNAAISPYTYWEQPGMALHTMGMGSYSMCSTHEIVVGNYCSIAHSLSVMGQRHPLDRVSSSSVTYDPVKPHFRAMFTDFALSPTLRSWPDAPLEGPFPVIEHDVWIGQQVILARGITIGTGAVVAAGSVVTKDVAPYTIVGGAPARVIRARFSDWMMEQLLASEWWTYAPGVLDLDLRDPAQFLSRLRHAQADDGIEPCEFHPINHETILKHISTAAQSSDPILGL